MNSVTRQEIFARAAKKLRSDFNELTNIPHHALKGSEAEDLIRTFLRKHLPKRFDVGSGFIIDPRDRISRQCDVVIYDALNCPVYRASEDAAIFPSNNVAAIVEVKSVLGKKEIEDAAEKIADAKSLAKEQLPDLPVLVTEQTQGHVFTFGSSISLEKISEHYCEMVRKHGFGRHIDSITILDKVLLTLAAKPKGGDWALAMMEGLGGDAAEGTHLAIGTQELKESSLDGFLRILLVQLGHFKGKVDHPRFRLEGNSFGGTSTLKILDVCIA